jgi:hypothetical protein
MISKDGNSKSFVPIRAGWELLEKFDDNRLRFKRRVDERKNDRHLDIDPYRTNIGMNEGKMVIAILGIVAAAMALIFGVVWVLKNYQG